MPPVNFIEVLLSSVKYRVRVLPGNWGRLESPSPPGRADLILYVICLTNI
jgi:hypothetical protein